MMSHQQLETFNLYNDASFVEAFHERATGNTHVEDTARRFAADLNGTRVLDVGCGTGRDACRFQQWGYEVVGVDYSPAMIERARLYAQQLGLLKPPHFEVVDMGQLAHFFPPHSFDGAWVCASLIHIPELDVPVVLKGLHHILVTGGEVFFAMKTGLQGTRLVREFKYGREIERTFTFWDEKKFTQVLSGAGFTITGVEHRIGGTTGDAPTQWLNVFADVVKG